MSDNGYCCRIVSTPKGFIGEFPDFPDLRAHGDTQEETLMSAEEILNERLACEVARGLIPPQPSAGRKGSYRVEVAPHIQVAIQIRKIRGKKTQKEIAQRLNITYQSYQLYENPVMGNPTIRNLEKVANALGKKLKVDFI